jgi:hypothetical protein
LPPVISITAPVNEIARGRQEQFAPSADDAFEKSRRYGIDRSLPDRDKSSRDRAMTSARKDRDSHFEKPLH